MFEKLVCIKVPLVFIILNSHNIENTHMYIVNFLGNSNAEIVLREKINVYSEKLS